MKTLTILKYAINFVFFSYIITSGITLFQMAMQDIDNIGNPAFWYAMIFIMAFHVVIFLLLYYLRNFVLCSINETPLNHRSRKHLRKAGLFCFIFAFLNLYEVFATVELFYQQINSKFDVFLMSYMSSGSFFFLVLVGLFFIYLSKVLEKSDEIRTENSLTI